MVRVDGFYEFGFGANVRLQPITITACRLPTHRALQGSIFTIYSLLLARQQGGSSKRT